MSNTKEKILCYALKLSKQKGYYGWSFDHISKEIGIKKSSIHYYFPTKEKLVTEVLNQYIADFLSSLEEVFSFTISNEEKLQKLFVFFKAVYDSEQEICLCTLMASDHLTLSEEGIANLENFYYNLHKWIHKVLLNGKKEGEFNRNLDCNKMANLIVTCLQGLMITSKITIKDQFLNCQEIIFLNLQ